MLIKYHVNQGLDKTVTVRFSLIIPYNDVMLCYFEDYGNQGYIKRGPAVQKLFILLQPRTATNYTM